MGTQLLHLCQVKTGSTLCVGTCPVFFEAVLLCGKLSCRVASSSFQEDIEQAGAEFVPSLVLNPKCSRLDSQSLENQHTPPYQVLHFCLVSIKALELQG